MIKVSVVILTFNQAAFIGKTIESALNQTTNFDYEILVGDDFSWMVQEILFLTIKNDILKK